MSPAIFLDVKLARSKIVAGVRHRLGSAASRCAAKRGDDQAPRRVWTGLRPPVSLAQKGQLHTPCLVVRETKKQSHHFEGVQMVKHTRTHILGGQLSTSMDPLGRFPEAGEPERLSVFICHVAVRLRPSLGMRWPYCGWTKSTSHHRRNPGMLIFP